MLPIFLPQTACLGKITSSCSAAPAKSTISPAQTSAGDTTAMHRLHLLQVCLTLHAVSLLSDSQNYWNTSWAAIILGPAILQETHLTEGLADGNVCTQKIHSGW